MNNCLTSVQLIQLLRNELVEPDVKAAELHLNDCSTCQSLLGHIAGEQYLPTGNTMHAETGLLSTVKLNLIQQNTLGQIFRPLETKTKIAGKTPGLLGKLDASTIPGSLGRFGDYEILELLGCGGMGVVYRATCSQFKIDVALKILQPHAAQNKEARARFLRESDSLSAIHHENVVKILAVKEIKRTPCIVMERIVGQTIEQRVNQQGAMDANTLHEIAIQAACGLDAAHAQGILHRDIKPANLMVDTRTGLLKITDFGLAKVLHDVGLTASDAVPGTPEYMSPEQIAGGKVDLRSDLFSLGTVLFFLATGKNPFAASNILQVFRNVSSVDPPNITSLAPSFDKQLAGTIAELLHKNPAMRPSNVRQLVSRLNSTRQS